MRLMSGWAGGRSVHRSVWLTLGEQMITTFRPTPIATALLLALALVGVAAAVGLAAGSPLPRALPAIGGQPAIAPADGTAPALGGSVPAGAPAEVPATYEVPFAAPRQPTGGSASGGSTVTTPGAEPTSTTPAAGSAPSSDAYGAAPSRWSEWPNDMPPPAILAPTQSLPKRPLPQTSP